ncbi:photosynthetic complex putative assembly protein PuhB [Aurantimonas sp. VKM B-3413]|uniref:photosynthetic complex putative assembly protein PuhB n=1 Tax=Aurantimonas sp. VKM B-3413 TaxID=2779401 RepID=UPI001E4EE6B8|nr:photosynthetic complex putative assembly protein PuhB [Aurantimonas sp. VKM B-3413]MCB8839088.1 PH domain-containing protein [Aurantimonas sp. VKM B-3413]
MTEQLDEFDHIKPVVEAGELPEGERILWQAQPDWWRLALSAFRLKYVVAVYLTLALWRVGATHHDTGSWAEGFAHASTMLPALAAGTLLAMLLSFLMARSTSFTLTDRRLVLRFGVALPTQLNIPLKDVDHAAVRVNSDGSGDIPLTLPKKGRPSYFQLWPFARPLKLVSAQPMLRAVPNAAEAANLIAGALAASQGGRRVTVAEQRVAPAGLRAGRTAAV